jgi:hypothetical protein
MRSNSSPYVGKGKLWIFFNTLRTGDADLRLYAYKQFKYPVPNVLKTFCKKGWGPANPEQKLAKNNDSAANMTLSFKRTPIKTVSGKQS